MRTFVLLFITLVTLSFAQAQNSGDKSSTYFFVRHAEKQDDGTKNPHLTDIGKERAKQLADLLRSYQIDAIYSTDYYRTIETAEPVSNHNKCEITIYNPRDLNIKKFKSKTKGKKVLVVGHSNSTPTFVNAMIGKEKYPQIDESDYSHFYIVTRVGDQYQSVLIHLD